MKTSEVIGDFTINHEGSFVSVPQSLWDREEDYPERVLFFLKEKKYFKQLNLI